MIWRVYNQLNGATVTILPTDLDFMKCAIEQASQARAEGEVPVGAVVVLDGKIIATGRNAKEQTNDPTAHAEMLAIRAATGVVGDWRLSECTLYVTLEPCSMCAGAMVLSRVGRCVYGTKDPKAGFLGSLADLSNDSRLNHNFEVTDGVLAEECSHQLKVFFRDLRRRP